MQTASFNSLKIQKKNEATIKMAEQRVVMNERELD